MKNFIVIEGADGSGKSTVFSRLSEYIFNKGINLTTARDPGGCYTSEKIREIVKYTNLEKVSQLLLFTGARIELINKTIKPALNSGSIVLCDRFDISTKAYQVHLNGLADEYAVLEPIAQQYLGDIKPHYIILDVTLETSNNRIKQRNNLLDKKDVFDNLENKNKLIEFYSNYQGENVTKIDANRSLNEVLTDLYEWVDNNVISK